MGYRCMKKLKVGYFSLSPNLSHPGDRRRVVFWAHLRGHELIINPTEQVDVVLVSENADMQSVTKNSRGTPIVLDLIDGYLAKEPLLKDYARGFSKVIAGQLHGVPKRFTKYISESCHKADAVICSTPEQGLTIKNYCSNVHIILDSHDELPLIPFQLNRNRNSYQIMWEGMPYTLAGIGQARSIFTKASTASPPILKVVSDLHYFRLLNKFGEMKTAKLLAREIESSMTSETLVPWSIDSLISVARQSSLAIIPINLSSPLQFLKPENRLLIMWRLGLPTLTSATPAYSRVAMQVNVDVVCRNSSDWWNKSNSLLNNAELSAEVVAQGQSYLKDFHNTDLLLEKWDAAIGSVT